MVTRARWIGPIFLVSAVVMLSAAARTSAPIPGYTYRIRTTTTNSSSLLPAELAHSATTADVIWAAGRGRMDYVEGGTSGVISVGDYMLFDSTDHLMVRPSDKSFYVFPSALGDTAKSKMAMAGVSTAMQVTSATFDSLGAEAIEGQAAKHYRINIVTAMTIDMSSMMSGIDLSDLPPEAAAALAPMKTTITMSSDTWVAALTSVPAPPAGSMERFARGMSGGGMIDSLLSLRKRIPAGRTMRTVTRVITSIGGPAARTDTSVTTSDMSAYTATEVDPDRLVLPADYSEKAMPGTESLGLALGTVDLTRWKKRP